MSVTELVSTIHVKDSITFTLNSEFLNHNFEVVKQCLLRIKDLQTQIGKSQQTTLNIQKKVGLIQQNIIKNNQRIDNNSQKIKELSNNVGDDFMKKMYAIEQKTKNIYDFAQTVRKIQQLNKFLPTVTFNQYANQTQKSMNKLQKFKEQFNRYVPNFAFQEYKNQQQIQLISKQKKIDELMAQICQVDQKISHLNDNFQKVKNQLNQNNHMIKQINFSQMLEKQRLYKEQLQLKVSELNTKVKKRVSHGELNALEKSMIEKLDKYLGENQRNKAEKLQTKGALQFLQKRINELEEIIIQKLSDQDKDALFTAKKIQCASCTKDLGKFQGKLGQYRPWSIFPCKELDPQKTGGFGYLNYIDKMSYKKGFDMEDQNLDRLNKTLSDPREKETPSKKLNSTRASNLISNFGTEERGSSLKDAYFKQSISQKGERIGGTSRNFRVSKKQPVKQLVEQQFNKVTQNK